MQTKDASKFAQMSGEARTALNMWMNIGEFTKISKFPTEDRICVFCGAKATSAEHLIDKAKGGNHTLHNVIPVCSPHRKPKSSWLSYSKEQQVIILERTGYNDEARMNPYLEMNDNKFQELRDLINKTVQNWREENGYA